MTDRVLTEDEVNEALCKGDERARSIVSALSDPLSLKKQFDQAIWAATHCLENFDLSEFKDRENDQKPADFLKIMLLGSFKAVQCVEVLQTELNRTATSLLLEGRASDLQMALLKAVTVYKTNGEDDSASFCAQHMISKYRGDEDDFPPKTPSANASMPRAS